MESITTIPALFTPPVAFASRNPRVRPDARGKFVFEGNEKIWLRGVTYGPFCPDEHGSEYHIPEQAARDFAMMAAHGINAIRTYTVPPRWLLDVAAQQGLHVLVSLPWEQHVAFLEDKELCRKIRDKVQAGARSCAGHPALLGLAIGNEIPASIVRWHGPERTAKFLEELYSVAKTEDPETLVTYVNYPSTEYLLLPFLDLVSFNVYLERREQLNSYLARLQNIAGERPLLLAEIGLDSRRNGQLAQARALEWQIASGFANGCAGAFVFAWTDEWYRGGCEILDWDFGLTDRERGPKPALDAVRKAFAAAPLRQTAQAPRMSVVVCSYNGARTIRECCEGLARVRYPNFEVIVVDDGSKDQTAAIASEYGFTVIRTRNYGLSHARNVGMGAATGEIIVYLDDDTVPDPDWLTYLAYTFETTQHAAVGGPNIAPPDDGVIAECVAHAPGNPMHVLISDQEAEHIPGCNLAVRKERLQTIGGFDPQFRVAGDDVDVCWRLRERGWTLGFNPAAMVWHHRRNSLRTYWRQQRGYGRAEALLETKWPAKYNAAGHMSWSGRVYGKGLRESLQLSRQRIYHGTFGSALFQSVYDSGEEGFWSLPLMPEWYLVIATLGILGLLGLAWAPLYLFLVLFAGASGLLLAQAARAAAAAPLDSPRYSALGRWMRRALIFSLHLIQPLARLTGRRWDVLARQDRQVHRIRLVPPTTFSSWHEQWQPAPQRLEGIERRLRRAHATVVRGSGFDRWDLEARLGLLGHVRLLCAVEEHGSGRQLVRVRTDPRWSPGGRITIFLFEMLAAVAALGGQSALFILLLFIAADLIAHSALECVLAMEVVTRVLDGAGQAHTGAIITPAHEWS